MGANASSLRPHDAGYVEDERVLLEIVKQKGEEAGLGLMIGEKGVLEYRGYRIEQLAEKATFEEVAFLVIYGELPTKG